MKIGVCGVSCEICPRRLKGACPNGEAGCLPRMNEFCKISTCALNKGVSHCFSCPEFPCETTRAGPISLGFCQYISG
ncbi:MAG: DUF3795 domain-containing protein [Methanothrix sp.]|jgi:hypothetical protein|nr:DUF3795 domain-containing protein [Methanothrix sp.]OPX80755.1 MAG: hypothetical protein A4E50_01426 [Methanosaeta sp. PtaB.Bin087]OPY53275.1 MAG: hypothetical protein A4E51_01165 [Methanosaeta sp. PtaU1.Bin055]NLX39462.1 DUF3795 domain-containing protein [Methanothrix sp.]HNT73234.1 DUF3795 domain-containing protein [Methanothrix sp.]